MKIQYPVFGNTVASRIKWKNTPSLIIIVIGGNDSERTKNWQNTPSFSAMYLGHEQFPQELTWPVKDCNCLIEWGDGRVEGWLTPTLPHQTVHAIFPHTAFRCSSHQGMR